MQSLLYGKETRQTDESFDWKTLTPSKAKVSFANHQQWNLRRTVSHNFQITNGRFRRRRRIEAASWFICWVSEPANECSPKLEYKMLVKDCNCSYIPRYVLCSIISVREYFQCLRHRILDWNPVFLPKIIVRRRWAGTIWCGGVWVNFLWSIRLCRVFSLVGMNLVSISHLIF